MFEAELSGEVSAFIQVVLIDIVLAGDNAVVVGLAAAGLPPKQRRQVIAWGVGVAFLLRVMFAVVALQLLQIIGLLLAGGILLLWVAWRMYRDLHPPKLESGDRTDSGSAGKAPPKTFGSAILQVAIADVSMSLDNVLAVAGAAQDHFNALVFGLALSIVLMGVAAGFIARLMERHRWIAYIGLVVVTYVALSMTWEGGNQLWVHFNGG